MTLIYGLPIECIDIHWRAVLTTDHQVRWYLVARDGRTGQVLGAVPEEK